MVLAPPKSISKGLRLLVAVMGRGADEVGIFRTSRLAARDQQVLSTQVQSDCIEHAAIWPEVDALGEPMELACPVLLTCSRSRRGIQGTRCPPERPARWGTPPWAGMTPVAGERAAHPGLVSHRNHSKVDWRRDDAGQNPPVQPSRWFQRVSALVKLLAVASRERGRQSPSRRSRPGPWCRLRERSGPGRC